MHFSDADEASEQVLNEIIWRSVKGNQPMSRSGRRDGEKMGGAATSLQIVRAMICPDANRGEALRSGGAVADRGLEMSGASTSSFEFHIRGRTPPNSFGACKGRENPGDILMRRIAGWLMAVVFELMAPRFPHAVKWPGLTRPGL